MSIFRSYLAIFLFFSLCVYLCKLTVIQRCIFAIQSHQFLVITHFLDVTIFHVQDNICILDGCQSVCNDKAGSSLHQFGKRPIIHFCWGLARTPRLYFGTSSLTPSALDYLIFFASASKTAFVNGLVVLSAKDAASYLSL